MDDNQSLSSSPAEEFLSLENLIKGYLQQIEELEKEVKEKKELLNDAFKSDAVYQEQNQKAKEINKLKAATKKEILKRPELAELAERIKEIKFDLEEKRALLNDYLQQYRDQGGSNVIDLENGETLEIVTITKVVRRSSQTQK